MTEEESSSTTSSILADTYALFDDHIAAATGAVPLLPTTSPPPNRQQQQQQRNQKFQGKFGGSPLHTYAKEGQWTKLLASATIDLLYILDEHHRTPLHYAIENGGCCSGADHQNVVLELIRIGPPGLVRVADADAKETPMHLACDYGMGLVTAYALLDADARHARGRPSVLTLKNANGKTPMDLIRKHDLQGTSSMAMTTTTTTTTDGNQQQPMAMLFMGMITSVKNVFTITPWKYYAEEHPAVLQALEETARGESGVVSGVY